MKKLIVLAVTLGALAIPGSASAHGMPPWLGRHYLGHSSLVFCWNGSPNHVYCNYPGWSNWCHAWWSHHYNFWGVYHVVGTNHGSH